MKPVLVGCHRCCRCRCARNTGRKCFVHSLTRTSVAHIHAATRTRQPERQLARNGIDARAVRHPNGWRRVGSKSPSLPHTARDMHASVSQRVMGAVGRQLCSKPPSPLAFRRHFVIMQAAFSGATGFHTFCMRIVVVEDMRWCSIAFGLWIWFVCECMCRFCYTILR